MRKCRVYCLALLLLATSWSVSGCRTIGSLMLSGRDYVTDAEVQVAKLKSEYVLAMGVLDRVEHKVARIGEVPKFKLTRADVRKIVNTMKAYWNETPKKKKTKKPPKRTEFDEEEAAEGAKNMKSPRKIYAVKITSKDAVKENKKCKGGSKKRLRSYAKMGGKKFKKWFKKRMKLVNEIRVLVKASFL